MAGRERASERLCQRAPGARRWKGRHVRDPRAQHPRLGARRFRTGADRRRGRPRLRLQLRARRRVPALPLGSRGNPLRGRRAARQGRGRLGRADRSRARADVPRSRRPGHARPRLRGDESDSARRCLGGDRGERPLHDHLHVGHDRAAEGLHVEPSELLRDGERRRPDGQLLPRRRPHAPLPPARAQLRAVDAPDGCVRRVPDRSPSRPASRRRGAAAGAPDDSPERPARVREGAHGGTGALRRGDGPEATAHRLGAPDRTPGEPARGRRRAGASRPPGPPPHGGPARLQQGARSARGPSQDRDLRRSAAREGDRGVLRRDRRAHRGGLRPHRVHDGVQHEPP